MVDPDVAAMAVTESLALLDHKRKLEDLETEPPSEEPSETNGDCKLDLVDSEETGAKRFKLDEKPDGSTATENGRQDEKAEVEPDKENECEPIKESSHFEAAVSQPDEAPGKKIDILPFQPPSVQDSEGTQEDNEPPLIKGHQEQHDSQQQDQPTSDSESITRRMEVPSNKVGALIGKAGDTVRYLQYNSGAKIQVMRDVQYDDAQGPTRSVEIVGTLDSVQKAEKLITAVIAEAEAGGSPALVARGHGASHGAGPIEQIEMPIPNEKVGLVIGRGGETIKGLQTRSGARIQMIPEHLSEGGDSRTVQVTGDKRQIDTAWEMIKEVMNQNVRSSSASGGFNHQGNRSRGPHQWSPRGHHMPPDYQQRGGPYASHNPPMGPRGWDQRQPPAMHHHQHQHGGPYNYYGPKGHSPGPSMGPPPHAQHGGPYNYNYGPPPPYSQPPNSRQSFNHGNDDHYYTNSQPYQHGSTPTGYGHQQYNKPPSCMPPQQYCPPRPNQNEVLYQATAPAQSYDQSVPPQQPYQYSSTAPSQLPPYYGGSAPPAEAYSQAPPAAGSAYAQPVTYYGQVAAPASYGQYAAPQAYEQAAANTAGYGYQGPQDPAYGAAPVSSDGQAVYGAQPAPQGYDQAAQPAGEYNGKTVSPQPQQQQPRFIQYDASQMYGQQQ